MQEGKALEVVLAIGQQRALTGKLHQPDRAARAGLHSEGDHAGLAVMAGIETRVGTEGFAFFQQAIQAAEAAGFEGVGIQGVGLGGLPQSQQLITETHHVGVGDVFEAQIERVRSDPPGLLGAKHTAIEKLAGLLLGLPTLGAHETVAQQGLTAFKTQSSDHPVAIERVVHPMAAALEAAWAVAVQGASQLSWDRAARSRELDAIELHTHVAEGAGPIGAVVANGRSDGHGRQTGLSPSSRNGLLSRA